MQVNDQLIFRAVLLDFWTFDFRSSKFVLWISILGFTEFSNLVRINIIYYAKRQIYFQFHLHKYHVIKQNQHLHSFSLQFGLQVFMLMAIFEAIQYSKSSQQRQGMPRRISPVMEQDMIQDISVSSQGDYDRQVRAGNHWGSKTRFPRESQVAPASSSLRTCTPGVVRSRQAPEGHSQSYNNSTNPNSKKSLGKITITES